MERQSGATYPPNKITAKTHWIPGGGHMGVGQENGHISPAQHQIEIHQYVLNISKVRDISISKVKSLI